MVDKLNRCKTDDDLLEKYNTIWGKASADIKKELDSKPV